MRVFSIDSYTDHIDYVIADNYDSACSMVNVTENTLITDISECFTDKEIKEVITTDLDIDEETIKELLKEYRL